MPVVIYHRVDVNGNPFYMLQALDPNLPEPIASADADFDKAIATLRMMLPDPTVAIVFV